MKKLYKPQSNRVIGIDCSSKSLAYAVFEADAPVTCGEIFFDGLDIYARLKSAKEKTQALVDSGVLRAGFIGLEAAIMVNNREVVIKLAYMLGAVMSVLMTDDTDVIDIHPIKWQTAFGVPNLTPSEKYKLEKENPNKSKTWLKAHGREIRKQRIMDKAAKLFDQELITSDNISDAIGIAAFANNTLTRR